MDIRGGVDSVLNRLHSAAEYVSASEAPLDTHGAHPVPSLLTRSIDDIKNVIDKGPPFSLSDLPAYVNAAISIINGGGIDDRLFFLEKLLTLMARLPKDSEFARGLQQTVISILYKDLPHPPSGYLALPAPYQSSVTTTDFWANWVDYAYRAADGSNNNPLIPNLGMAGSPYARSVPSLRRLSPAALPPPELLFDKLLKRDKFEPHPGGISSLFFAFANIIIHNIFNTDPQIWVRNRSSSYLDLGPLYGNSQETVNSVRKFDGTGQIHNDVFADSRLIYMPPAVCALLVLFSRNHNYVAQKILSINERGTFHWPPPSNKGARDRQDEEIFQRARLVNTNYFMQMILRDYVGAILGLVRDGSEWRLDPLMDMRESNHDVSPRGEGNVVSIEFNLLYRWHATSSEPDRKSTEELFTKLLPGFDMKTISVADFLKNAARSLHPGPDVKRWEFGGIKRDESGRFNDADIARILQNATEAPASAFKACGTPEVLRVMELLGIEQGRAWGACTLNEFRKFMGLQRKLNSDVAVSSPFAAAEALYHDIDNLELYVGLQAEQAKEPMPGAGLCPGFTISRAILSDAVALTRGDRFMTTDHTPFNLTTWGYNDCQANTSDGSYGGMLTKLLFRHLPSFYPVTSTYAHFPFLVPRMMKNFAREISGDLVAKYKWDRPLVPNGPTVVLKRYSEVQQVFAESTIFNSGAEQRLNYLCGGVRLNIPPIEQVLTSDKQLEEATRAISQITEGLIKSKKLNVGPQTMYLDVVRDVINLIPVYWLSNNIVGLPLKTEQNPHGAYRDQELHSWFANIANYVYHDTERENEWFLRDQSQTATRETVRYLKGHLARQTRGLTNVEGLTASVVHWVSGRNDFSDGFLRQLVEATGSHSGTSALDGLACSIFAAVVPTAALFSQILAHVVNFYLDKSKAAERAEIIRLVDGRKNAQVMPFIFEAIHVQLSSLRLTARSATSVGSVKVAERQVVLASVLDATHDGSTFENPDTPNYRQSSARVDCVLGLDPKGLLSPKLFEQVAPLILGQIFKLKNLSRQSGLGEITQNISTVPGQYYSRVDGILTPFPVSLVVQLDQNDVSGNRRWI
ncbi:heme peroxidase [Lactifluus volemus]|nr:heme peroxidase [Lactifluus volemus]